jgi:hypothetical protein
MIWKHGFESSAKIPGANPDWNCGICGQKYSTRTTVHAKDHLRETHGIEEDSRASRLTTLHSFRPVKEDKLRELIVEWIVDRRHAFNEVKAASFRMLVEYLNPMAVNKVPRTGDTVRADVMSCYQVAKVTIQKNLSRAKSKIHLSFDLWTSPNHKAIVAIVGHWTSHKFKVETALLGMREMTGAHKGKFIAPVLHSVVKEYGIQDNLGYF